MLMVLSNELKKESRDFARISDGDLFKDLRFCKLETQLGKNPGVYQREKKLKVLTAKSTFLRIISPASLGQLSDDRLSG